MATDMRIMEQHVMFDIEFEAGGIVFYAFSDNENEIKEIKQAFSNISENEEQKLISVLKEMFYIKKPCGAIWRLTVAGREMMFYLNGYQIEVTTA